MNLWTYLPIHTVFKLLMWNRDFLASEDLSRGLTGCDRIPLHPEDGGSMVLWNAGILSQHYMTSQLRRPKHELKLLVFTWTMRFLNGKIKSAWTQTHHYLNKFVQQFMQAGATNFKVLLLLPLLPLPPPLLTAIIIVVVIVVFNFTVTDYLWRLDIDGRIILKWKQGVDVV
jgi:hypothetical protein